MIPISSVSENGIVLIHVLLSMLPKRQQHQNKDKCSLDILIDGIHNVPGVGTVASGFVNSGRARVGNAAFLGPLNDGTYMKTIIKIDQIY